MGAPLAVAEVLGQPGTLRVLFALLMLGVFGGLFIVPLYAMMQSRSAAAHRARVIAANNIMNALFMVAGALAAGSLLGAGLSIPALFGVANRLVLGQFTLDGGELGGCVGQAMLIAARGLVVNISSAGSRCYMHGPAYGAGKAAVSRLSGVLATELGAQGIRAFTVNPGVVDTEALQATIGAKGVQALGGRVAPPQVPADVMVWLATSPEADGLQKRTLNAQSLAKERGLGQAAA